jgi:hypothetical protein
MSSRTWRRSLASRFDKRLVEQQHLRFQHQRAGHRHPLLLAARQLAGQPVVVALEPDQVEPGQCPVARLVFREAGKAEPVG